MLVDTGAPPGDAGPGVDAAGITAAVTAFCDGGYQAALAGLATCCTAADMQTSEYGVAVGGASLGTSSCIQQFVPSVVGGRAAFDADAAASCQHQIQATFAAGCWGALDGKANQAPPTIFANAACSGVITGLQGVGKPCADDYECADGLTCVGETASQDGVCQTPPAVGAPCGGMSCAGNCGTDWGFGNHPECAPGGYCDDTCQALSSSGQPCQVGFPSCAGSLVCVQTGIQGFCMSSYAGEGGICGEQSNCQVNLYCDYEVEAGGYGECEPRGTAGASCKDDYGCLGYCNVPDGGAEGTCVAICGSK
jgi:hypothetical protein